MKFLSAIFTFPEPGPIPFWRRFVSVIIGLPMYGLAVAIMIQAGIGLEPWGVFHQALSNLSGISYGTVAIIVGAAVLLLWIPLRQKLGLGTAMNVIIIGVSVDLFLPIIPVAPNFWWGLLEFSIGIFLNGVAIALYVGGGLGPGPRDGLMTGLVNRFDKPVWLVRTSIDIVVRGMGWLLGGPVGLGTVYYALTIGPVAHMLMPWFALDKRTQHVNADGSLDGDHPIRPGQESFDGD
jgi:uncharacterized membrane protein YczE